MNKGTKARDYVQNTATFYDANKSILGSEFTFTDPTSLQPGQSAPFKISLTRKEKPLKSSGYFENTIFCIM